MEVPSKENAEVLFGFVRNSADNSTSIIDGALDNDLFSELVRSASRADVNEYVKKSFAAVLGVLAGVAALPLGPAMALIDDQAFSTAFEEAYENANEWSSSLNWASAFDFIEVLLGAHRFDGLDAVGGHRGDGDLARSLHQAIGVIGM